tara:strand:- start:1427 stop:1576 length:150 start_codon:yes stop_codon:yes gene_type:complete
MKTPAQQQKEIDTMLDGIELRLIELVNEYQLLINKKHFWLKKKQIIFRL